MDINQKTYNVNGTCYIIRPAINKDAKDLSKIRLQIDGETQNLDREKGEAFIDAPGFEQLIIKDSKDKRNLFFSCNG